MGYEIYKNPWVGYKMTTKDGFWSFYYAEVGKDDYFCYIAYAKWHCVWCGYLNLFLINVFFLFELFLVLFLNYFETSIHIAQGARFAWWIAGVDRCDLFLTYAVQAIVLGWHPSEIMAS